MSVSSPFTRPLSLNLPPGGKPVDTDSMVKYTKSLDLTIKGVAAICVGPYDVNEMTRNLLPITDRHTVIRLHQGIDATGHAAFLGAGFVGVMAMSLSRKPVEERTPFDQGMILLATLATISLAVIGMKTVNFAMAQHDFNMIVFDDRTRFISETSNPLSDKDPNLLERYSNIENLGKNGNVLYMAGTPVLSVGSNHCSIIAVEHSCLMQIVERDPDMIQLKGQNYSQLDNKEKAIVATLLLNLYNESSVRIQSPRMISYSDQGKESMFLNDYARDLTVSLQHFPPGIKPTRGSSRSIRYDSLCLKVQEQGRFTKNLLHENHFGPKLLKMKHSK